jgi:hypothetical protein
MYLGFECFKWGETPKQQLSMKHNICSKTSASKIAYLIGITTFFSQPLARDQKKKQPGNMNVVQAQFVLK